MPVFDQPDLKARVSWQLRVPEGWVAVANGPESPASESSESESPESEALDRTARVFTFAPTRPIPTYLMAFAAGRFTVETAEREGRRYQMFHRETDTAKVERNRDEIFNLVAQSMAWMEDYTGIEHPFAKHDFVLIPSFQYGGMEHPGAVFYRAESLLLEASATQNAQLARASLIAHETAHMWFGNLVTMRWFDDVWTKEVFANFLAAKMVHPAFPEVDHDLRFLLAHHPAAGGRGFRQRVGHILVCRRLTRTPARLVAPVIARAVTKCGHEVRCHCPWRLTTCTERGRRLHEYVRHQVVAFIRRQPLPPRRVAEYAPEFQAMNVVVSVSGFVLGISTFILLYNMLWSLNRGRIAGANPWKALTLEWMTTSPPPPYNFIGDPVAFEDPYGYGTEASREYLRLVEERVIAPMLNPEIRKREEPGLPASAPGSAD